MAGGLEGAHLFRSPAVMQGVCADPASEALEGQACRVCLGTQVKQLETSSGKRCRPCRGAQDPGGDAAALGAFRVPPKAKDVSTWKGSNMISQPLGKSPFLLVLK